MEVFMSIDRKNDFLAVFVDMTSKNVFVNIPQGTLKGLEERSLLGNVFYSFQKIPYAKPPVGQLRFQAPEAAEGWIGVRDATQMGLTCPSLNVFSNEYLESCDEDSLFVNVYSKQITDNAKLPVLFWIHGGAFRSGSGNKDIYGPDYWMLHDVVLVTFNYRLGALGFLSLQTPECPGNFGLKDQRLALKWVQRNIRYFGGDPENVTIFGESAGGASVHYLLLSPSTRGLFHRAITQSGSALNPWAYSKYPRECAFILGKRLGCDTTDDAVLLDFLRKTSAKDITEKSNGMQNELKEVNPGEDMLSSAFNPTSEPESKESIISKHPRVLMKEGSHQDVPFLAGVCRREMLLVLRRWKKFADWSEDKHFQALIPRELNLERDGKLSLEIAQRIRKFYFKNGIEMDNFVDAVSANFFVYGIYRMVKFHLANKNFKSPNYLYRFSFDGERRLFKCLLGGIKTRGPSHAEDIAYQFPTNMMPLPPLQFGSPDHKMIIKFTKLLVDFATTGSPTSESSEVSWLPADKDMSYLDIGDELCFRKGFFEKDMQFWDEIYDLVRNNVR